MDDPVAADPRAMLRRYTNARVGLRQAGHAIATGEMLDFQADLALAREAVWRIADHAALAHALDAVFVRSQAGTRARYLQRPDLGRLLREDDRRLLCRQPCDVLIVVGDGLSSLAVERHAVELEARLRAELRELSIARTVVVEHARVAIGDEVAALVGCRLVVMLIGERPGLSSPDSLGAYLTFAPSPGCGNERRNCVSNIGGERGLSRAEAAHRIAWLAREALRLRVSGIGLNERSQSYAALLADGRGSGSKGG